MRIKKMGQQKEDTTAFVQLEPGDAVVLRKTWHLPHKITKGRRLVFVLFYRKAVAVVQGGGKTGQTGQTGQTGHDSLCKRHGRRVPTPQLMRHERAIDGFDRCKLGLQMRIAAWRGVLQCRQIAVFRGKSVITREKSPRPPPTHRTDSRDTTFRHRTRPTRSVHTTTTYTYPQRGS